MIQPRSLPTRDTTSRRPPLKEIADLLGVSKMTVSRALREGTSVDAQLRAKIQETARKVGYQPDSRISQVMSAIRKSKSPLYRETLAMVWTHRRSEALAKNPFLQEIYSGANLQAQQFGYKLDEFYLTDPAMTGHALSRILHSRGIRGVLIAPPGPERAYPHIWLDWQKFATVFIGRSFVNTGVARVQPDHYFACVLAIRRLKRLRYKRMALVMSRAFDEQTGFMVRSAFRSFHPLGPKDAEKLIYTANQHDPKALARWMAQAKAEVILASFDDAFPRLEHLTSGAGADIDIAALSWNRNRPDIAGVNLQLPLVGEHAIDMLLQRLQRNLFGLEDTAPTIHVPGAWMDGPSVRQITGSDFEAVNAPTEVFATAKVLSRFE